VIALQKTMLKRARRLRLRRYPGSIPVSVVDPDWRREARADDGQAVIRGQGFQGND
jgi:hypothetical protein